MNQLECKRNQKTCHCSAYQFPHRWGSGHCEAPGAICNTCHKPAEGIWVETLLNRPASYNSFEQATGWYFVSECCEDELLNPITMATRQQPMRGELI